VEDIMRINDRKFAASMASLSVLRNFWFFATTNRASNFPELCSILSSSPQIRSLFVAGFLSLIITAVLLSPVKLDKVALLAMTLVTVAVFILAIVPNSFSLLLVVPLPWSIFSLYLLKTMKAPVHNH